LNQLLFGLIELLQDGVAGQVIHQLGVPLVVQILLMVAPGKYCWAMLRQVADRSMTMT